MRKNKPDELRAEYRKEDLGRSVRGKHLKEYQSGTNLVFLSPDVAKAFPTEDSVNDALRSLIKVAQRTVNPAKRSSHRKRTDKPLK